MKKVFLWLGVLGMGLTCNTPSVFAEFTSTNYSIESFSIGDAKRTATSTNYGVDAIHGLEYIYDAPSSSSGSSGGGGGGGANPAPEILTLSVAAGTTTVTVQWSTDIATKGTLRWGESTSYELGTINQDSLVTTHSVTLNSLTPETTYFFELYSLTGANQDLITTSQFSTNAVPVTGTTSSSTQTTLSAPSDFIITGTTNSIGLQWTNPTDTDFSEVLVVRSLGTYPQTTSQGLILYTGTNESFFDTQVLQGQTYYYTLFARGSSGAISNGIFGTGQLQNDTNTPPTTPPANTSSGGAGGAGAGGTLINSGGSSSNGNTSDESGESVNTSSSGSGDSQDTQPARETTASNTTTGTLGILLPTDLIFVQEDSLQSGDTSQLTFVVGEPVTFSLSIPESDTEIGQVWIEVIQAGNESESISVLLRKSLKENVYSAELDPLAVQGSYRYVVSIYDNSATLIEKIEGTFDVVEATNSTRAIQEDTSFVGSFTAFVINNFWLTLVIAGLPIIIGFFLLFFYTRRREEEDEEELVPVT